MNELLKILMANPGMLLSMQYDEQSGTLAMRDEQANIVQMDGDEIARLEAQGVNAADAYMLVSIESLAKARK